MDDITKLQNLTKVDEHAVREARKKKLVDTRIFEIAAEARRCLKKEIESALKETWPFFDRVARLNFDRLYVYLPAPVQTVRHLLDEARPNFEIPARILQGLTELEAHDPYAKFEDDYELRRWASRIEGLLNHRNVASTLRSLKAQIEWELAGMVHTLEYNAGRGIDCFPPAELSAIVRGTESKKEPQVDSQFDLR